ncbi:hypothetical protein WME98_50130 [Sorangium sp. So ce296]|uniref:hypothetical protein n=1 Tax=Sorangium sp. So ce296 TaxID=3133296 RepID=UPI003F63B11A
MNAQGSIQAVTSKPDRGQMNGAGAPRPAEEAGATESPTKLREYPPRALLNEVLALHERWRPRDLARTTQDENEAADACLYTLPVLAMMIRAPGTPLARFIEGQLDLLSDAAMAIEGGERRAYGQADAPPATSRRADAPAAPAAAPAPMGAPRQERRSLHILGIERDHDDSTLHHASVPELLAWSFAGEDPVTAILDALADDLDVLLSVLGHDQQHDAVIDRQLWRAKARAKVAATLHERVMIAIDDGDVPMAPARHAPPQPATPAADSTAAPAAYKTTYDIRWQTEDMLDRAAGFLDTFAELIDRRTALDQENVAATTRLAVRAAGDTAREMLRQALVIAEMDANQATTTEEQLRFVDIIDWLRAALDGVEAAAEQNEKTRFRRRDRRMKACGAILRAQCQLRQARESAAAASAVKRAALASAAQARKGEAK